MSIELSGGGFRIVIDPTLGGAIVAADWHDIPIFIPRDPELDPFKTGCFAMLPFTNRIADGRFRFDGQNYQLEINNQDENVAIHGHSRNMPWLVPCKSGNSINLVQHFAEHGNPYEYEARQEIVLSDAGFRIEVSLRNGGDRPMPFGLGIHPWFARSPGTKLLFVSDGTFEQDARNLPLPQLRQVPAFDPEHPIALDDIPWLDGCFVGWASQQARIERPHDDVGIVIEATGALRHLHVFVPDNRNVFCAEPVSHVPDAVNRPELGRSFAMDVLAPGAVLSGAMTLRASPYSAV